jgi:hypothetical protein
MSSPISRSAQSPQSRGRHRLGLTAGKVITYSFFTAAVSEYPTCRKKQHLLNSRKPSTSCSFQITASWVPVDSELLQVQQAFGIDTCCPYVFFRFVNSQFPGLLESRGGDRSPSCDPSSAFANPCFSSDGSALICCPFSCAVDEGQGPRCEGFVGDTPLIELTSAPGGGATGPSSTAIVNGVCDPGSSFPNQCFSADGSSSVCCSASCPSSPGPVAICGP